MGDVDGVDQQRSSGAAGHEQPSGRGLRRGLWFVVVTAVAIVWWIVATPITCAAGGGPTVVYPPCPSTADRTTAAVVVTAGYAVLAAVGTLALTYVRRSRPLGVATLTVAAAAAVPAWLWVAHPLG